MQNFIISQQLAQAVLDYLVQQPFREVAALVSALQRMPVVPEATAAAAEAKKDAD